MVRYYSWPSSAQRIKSNHFSVAWVPKHPGCRRISKMKVVIFAMCCSVGIGYVGSDTNSLLQTLSVESEDGHNSLVTESAGNTTLKLYRSSTEDDEGAPHHYRTLFKVMRSRSGGGMKKFCSGLRGNPRVLRAYDKVLTTLYKVQTKRLSNTFDKLKQVGKKAMLKHGETIKDSILETVGDEINRIENEEQFKAAVTLGNLGINLGINLLTLKGKHKVDQLVEKSEKILKKGTIAAIPDAREAYKELAKDVGDNVKQAMDELADMAKDDLKGKWKSLWLDGKEKNEQAEAGVKAYDMATFSPFLTAKLGPAQAAYFEGEILKESKIPPEYMMFNDLKKTDEHHGISVGVRIQEVLWVAPQMWHEIPGNYQKMADARLVPGDIADGGVRRHCDLNFPQGDSPDDNTECVQFFNLYLCEGDDCEDALQQVLLRPDESVDDEEDNDDDTGDLAAFNAMKSSSCIWWRAGYGPDCSHDLKSAFLDVDFEDTNDPELKKLQYMRMAGVKYCIYYDYDEPPCLNLIQKRSLEVLETNKFMVEPVKTYFKRHQR
eukprot:CAMPEP_0197945332 /NCGR_PEP_ID=MMETSP1439-20131203/125850_1 /TAXON_ID=66791 /ORGANISM="Gonyaulax spinifera, Strain CCMP409" /LENGTH=546 /DNA_ID=CAMNT_0043568587 /DNA_START=189 /DNA_END=1829 /DNA_ORIENTATION=+